MRRSRTMKPIFMIGMPRSGTTAISEAMSLHEELGWFSVYLERYPALPWLSLLDHITAIPKVGLYLRGKKKQDKAVASMIRKYLPYPNEAFPVWTRFCGEKFASDYLVGQKASEEERDMVVTYIQKVLRFGGKSRFFAKFTGPPRTCYLNSIFPDAYYIHVIRDPRAVVSSLLKVQFWKEGGGHVRPWWRNGLPDEYVKEWEDTGRSPVALAAVQWKRVVELAREEEALIPPERYVRISYEDIVEDPHGLLSMLFKKVALSDSVAAHSYITSFGKLRNMNSKYKKYLDASEIALVERITAETAAQAGYDF